MGKGRSNTRLFAPDGYTFKCWIDPQEARDKFERGELDIATHPATHEAIGYKLRESFETSNAVNIHASQSSISLSEMLLNVGISNRSEDPPAPRVVQAAQAKIQIWPYVWDERATCVRTV